ncbi:hypothetical protein [Ciceribacter ferrooxidans]|uniref:hypothetical protein n=1 Tax=Ciceribacter ferrooxidans TaxID=2509717 RepID=UPI00196A2B2A|nr:hypothetical protein [Ciceribacter ferrooxidans]
MTVRLCRTRIDSFRADGSLMDLAAPMAEEVSFSIMAARLSRIARFNGTPHGGYSVAQHCAMGAQAILNEGGDELLAALFLLHDGHESFVGDKTRPVQSLERTAIRMAGGEEAAAAYDRVHRAIRDGWDWAIYTAAGLPAPAAWSKRMRTTVAAMDERMLYAEAVALFGSNGAAWVKAKLPALKSPTPKLTGAIRPWGAMKAEEAFIAMFDRLLGYERRMEASAVHAAHVSLTEFREGKGK